jgi:hypothetical protein
VTSIDTLARRSGSNQRPLPRPTLIFSPEVKSESSTTTSARRSRKTVCDGTVSEVQPSQSGLAATPTAT